MHGNVASYSGTGSWDKISGSWQLSGFFGGDVVGFTEFMLSGTIDTEALTATSEGVEIPIVAVG